MARTEIVFNTNHISLEVKDLERISVVVDRVPIKVISMLFWPIRKSYVEVVTDGAFKTCWRIASNGKKHRPLRKVRGVKLCREKSN